MNDQSNSLCKLHSGHVESLRNLFAENTAQWKRIETLETKVDKILNRLTWAAIMFAFATIALIGNLIAGKF